MKFALLDELSHGISTRNGGVSEGPYRSLNLGYSTADDEAAVATNRARFVESLDLPARVVSGWVSHGKGVSVFRSEQPDSWPLARASMRPGSAHSEELFRSDSLVSDVPALGFMLTFADCVPLLFFDRRRGILGIAHAGWRGTAQGIAREVIAAMKREFRCSAADISVGIGPSIGPCCYTVMSAVPELFVEYGQRAYLTERNQAQYLDLWAANEFQLTDAGVRRDAIENPRICTSCRRDQFFSHRAEHGLTGRFGLCAALA